jgi:hypothetical protein
MGGKREEQSFTSLNNLSEDWFTSNETTQDNNRACVLCASKPREMILDELLAEVLAPIGYCGWRMCLLLPLVCVLEAKPSAIARWRGKVRNVVKVFIAVMFLVSSLEEVWLLQSAPLLVSLSLCLAPLLHLPITLRLSPIAVVIAFSLGHCHYLFQDLVLTDCI